MPEPGSQPRRVRDAAGARTAILNAAEVVFAEHGFDGARIDTIAAEAGYNKSLIFQYFGDKLTLYAEVLTRADREARELRARVFAPLLEDEAIASNAHRLLRILLWEMAEGWQTYARISAQFQIEHVEQLELLFQKAQRAGLIRSTFVPVIQLTMALQICQSYLACLPLFQMLLTEDLSSSAALARARAYIVGLVVAGIMVDPRTPAAQTEP
jgi:AcrR family transcriptional regulator